MTHRHPSELFGWLEEYRRLQEKRRERSLTQREQYRHSELEERLSVAFAGRRRPSAEVRGREPTVSDSFEASPNQWSHQKDTVPRLRAKLSTGEHPSFLPLIRGEAEAADSGEVAAYHEAPSHDNLSSDALVGFALFPPEPLK